MVGLLTTVNEVHSRVAMHAVRVELLEVQAKAVGLPLWKVSIPSPCSNAEYEAAMLAAIERAKAEGGKHRADLPPNVDPCGEKGEFHTFAYDGPMFRHPVPVQLGEIVKRDGFVFADLLHPIFD